jgi:SAM-dependent methyltransferase
LDKFNSLNVNNGINFQEFERLVLELEDILHQEAYHQQNSFKDWSRTFKPIYGKEKINLRIFTIFSQIFYIIHLFIVRYLLNKHENAIYIQDKLIKVKEIQKSFLNEFSSDITFLNNYFLPLIEFLEAKQTSFLEKLTQYTFQHLFNKIIKPEYLFDLLIQRVLSPTLRHNSGEFYTPSFLVKKMVRESYQFGERILDPSCGTGNFLIEIVKLILSAKKSSIETKKALENIYGFDINPISILMTILNISFLVGKKLTKIGAHFIITDSIFYEMDLNYEKFDLIIGNPPWYTFRDLDSVEYQNQIKKLATDLGIKPSPKNILNIEISSLFFYKAKTFMKPNAKIFFVITKGIITGSHASRFRQFKGFKDVKIWLFDKKIEQIFHIDFICLYALKGDSLKSPTELRFPSIFFDLEQQINQINYFDDVKLKVVQKEILIPYSIEKKSNKIYVHKLIPITDYQRLIPVKSSIYKKKFHKGADLNPRNLIFITFRSKKNSTAIINPDERIFKRAKSPWNKKIFHNTLIEKEYIFKVIKSTELVKFNLFNFYHVFLPISRQNYPFNYDNLKQNAKAFYDKINEYYMSHKKSTTKHSSLMDNLNRWDKLINKRQFSPLKVVYNNSGSILSAAVVRGDFLITGDLSFFSTENSDEAYYLSAILNSNLINQQIRIKKSSRHIFKIPFESPIQKYDSNNLSHQQLAQLGLQGEKIAKALKGELYLKKSVPISRFKFQNLLAEKIKSILKQIDEYLKPQFFNSN